MEKALLMIVLVIAPTYFSNAQVSWMSRPLQSNSYVAPIDQNLLFNSMAQRQQQYNRNVQKIQDAVLEATEIVRGLKGINDQEYNRLSSVLENSLKKLNAQKRDYGLNEVSYPIIKHFSEIKKYGLVSREYLLPDSIDFTNF